MRRPPATLADYVLVGINPALIMVLVGSLVFFLLEVFYRGDHGLRVAFIFAMFIMGAVAVCRLSMEEGTGYAATFGMPLGVLTLIALNRFGEFHGPLAAFSMMLNAGIVVLIWWLAYQLTWDCTLLDERGDTSDQGLLQAVGFQQEATDGAAAIDGVDPALAAAVAQTADDTSSWRSWFERSKQPHAHGVWVIYFSLGALPIFAFGQPFIPANSRTYVFFLVLLYVATALALLLSTSFLGLRRYLRRRHLEMPLEMTATWLGVGGVLIVVVLAACLLLPRPGAELAISQLPPIAFGNKALSPSRTSVGNDGKQRDDQSRSASQEPGKASSSGATQAAQQQRGRSGGSEPSRSGPSQQGTSTQQQAGSQNNPQSSSNQGSGDQAGKSSEQSNPSQENRAGQSSNEKRPDESSQGKGPTQQSSAQAAQQSHQGQQSEQQSQPQPSPSQAGPPPDLGNVASFLGGLMKWLVYIAVAAVLAYFAWRYREQLYAGWLRLLDDLRELWARLFGGRDAKRDAPAELRTTKASRQPFQAFTDPFMSGRASRMTRVQLLYYTFEALQAWARERGCARQESETPHEFAQRLGTQMPSLSREAALLVEHYGLATYASAVAQADPADVLRSLWHKMQQPQLAASHSP